MKIDEVAPDGGVCAFNAPFYGSAANHPASPATVGIIANPDTTSSILITTTGTPTRFGT